MGAEELERFFPKEGGGLWKRECLCRKWNGIDQEDKGSSYGKWERDDAEKHKVSPQLAYTYQRKWIKFEKMETSSVDVKIIVERSVLRGWWKSE